MSTSSRMRSTSSLAMIASASSPEDAVSRWYPRGARTASSNLRFCGRSSTARTVTRSSMTGLEEPADLFGQVSDADGLLDEPVEPSGLGLLAVLAHGEGGHRDDGDAAAGGVRAQA